MKRQAVMLVLFLSGVLFLVCLGQVWTLLLVPPYLLCVAYETRNQHD